ncbi:PpiC-type peptidyl-prolyl cis-trans isomerase [Candidatus Omnitrophus magneticus]|uniref:peptidylprolyl isomerase n=1 Tax=Candidatus Omnitrophus magneticus TaxID=1609969 RepID=A0A0F0CSG5_9BACT|nr:PpiC-type peptidyl-prolyl cis-trans isomerase [Candidatus Omnitrophus magneticus]
MKVRNNIFFVIAVLFLAGGCGNSNNKDKVLAVVGDRRITVSQFNEHVSNLPARYIEIVKKRKQEFLKEIINDMLIYKEAVKYGVDRDKEVLRVVEEARKKIVIARFIKDKIDDKVKVTDEEIEDQYRSNQNAYMFPEVLKVSHILVRTNEDAVAIKKELKKGIVFEELAKIKSLDPTAQNGGDIGYFPKGQLIPEFENACASLKVGDISDPVKTKLGYHIIKLTDKKPPVPRPLEQVKEQIRANLYAEKRREKFSQLVDELNTKTKVKIEESVLKEALEDLPKKAE